VSQPEVLSQAFELGYTYTRSTGPVVGRFLTELRERKIVGIKASDGRVIVPPMEYDPDTAEDHGAAIRLGDDQTRWRRCTDDSLRGCGRGGRYRHRCPGTGGMGG